MGIITISFTEAQINCEKAEMSVAQLRGNGSATGFRLTSAGKWRTLIFPDTFPAKLGTFKLPPYDRQHIIHSITAMNTFEKIYSILALLFALSLLFVLMHFPELRQLNRLLIASLLGLLVNIGLMFIVLRDILLRRFNDRNMRYIWLGLVLLVWPSIVYYLVRYGFRSRI